MSADQFSVISAVVITGSSSVVPFFGRAEKQAQNGQASRILFTMLNGVTTSHDMVSLFTVQTNIIYTCYSIKSPYDYTTCVTLTALRSSFLNGQALRNVTD